MSEHIYRQKPDAWRNLRDSLCAAIREELTARGHCQNGAPDCAAIRSVTGISKRHSWSVSAWLRNGDGDIGLQAALQVAEALGIRVDHTIRIDAVASAAANRRISNAKGLAA